MAHRCSTWFPFNTQIRVRRKLGTGNRIFQLKTRPPTWLCLIGGACPQTGRLPVPSLGGPIEPTPKKRMSGFDQGIRAGTSPWGKNKNSDESSRQVGQESSVSQVPKTENRLLEEVVDQRLQGLMRLGGIKPQRP